MTNKSLSDVFHMFTVGAISRPEDIKKYERLRTTIFGLISTGLETTNVDFLSIQTRVKEKASILRKLKDKDYENGITDMTDIVGGRVILYLESDIGRAEKVIREMFDVDEENSVDKLNYQSSRTIGYRSLHLVCTLGKRRQRFIEYKDITNLKFEIQIRTALQHAWAEIEHKQNYKSDSYLPPNLERRLMLLSAALENADREFSEIVSHVDNYSEMVENSDARIQDDPISSVSLRGVTSKYLKKLRLSAQIDAQANYSSEEEFIRVLKAYGIKKNSDLDSLYKRVPISKLRPFSLTLSEGGWYRIPQFILIVSDCEGYYTALAKDDLNWVVVESVWKYLDKEYPNILWRKIAKENSIEIETTADERVVFKNFLRSNLWKNYSEIEISKSKKK